LQSVTGKTWHALRSSLSSSSDSAYVAMPIDKTAPSAVISAKLSLKNSLKCQWLRNISPIRKVPPDERVRGNINIPSGKERASGILVIWPSTDLKDRLVWKWRLTHLKCQHLNISTSNAQNAMMKDSQNSCNIYKSSQLEFFCKSATCVDIQWNEMSCLAGPRCYIIIHKYKHTTIEVRNNLEPIHN